MTSSPTTSAFSLDEATMRARPIRAAAAGCDDLGRKLVATLDRVRNLPRVEGRHVWDGVFAEALAALGEVETVVRSRLEEARRLAGELNAELDEAERQHAERVADEARRARFEATVAQHVQDEEAARLRRIEDDVRSNLATIAGGVR